MDYSEGFLPSALYMQCTSYGEIALSYLLAGRANRRCWFLPRRCKRRKMSLFSVFSALPTVFCLCLLTWASGSYRGAHCFKSMHEPRIYVFWLFFAIFSAPLVFLSRHGIENFFLVKEASSCLSALSETKHLNCGVFVRLGFCTKSSFGFVCISECQKHRVSVTTVQWGGISGATAL